MERKPLSFSYNAETDIVEIEGVKYSGRLFRFFAFDDTERIFKFKRDKNGFITILVI